MKKYILIVFAVILLFLLSGSAYDSTPLDECIYEGFDSLTTEMPNSLQRYLSKDELSKENGVLSAFSGLIKTIPDEIEKSISLPLTLLGTGTAIIVLYALFSTVKTTMSERTSGFAANLASSVAFSLCVSKCVITLIENATRAVENTSLAVLSAVPVFAGVVAASGNVTAASVFGFSVSAVSSAASMLINGTLLPLSGVILGIGLVSPLYDNGLSSLVEGIKKCAVWVLGIVTSLFITALSLQTAVSGSTDFLLLKTARFLATSTVPIIGSSLSEATATLSSSLKLIKSTLGASAIIVILFSTLPQIIINILCSFALSINVVCADVIGLSEPQKCIKTIKAAIDILTAIMVFFTLSLIISVAIMIGISR